MTFTSQPTNRTRYCLVWCGDQCDCMPPSTPPEAFEQLEELNNRLKTSMPVLPTGTDRPRPDLPAEDSLRDFVDEKNTYILQEYKWGVWNTILRLPAHEEALIKMVDYIESHPGWPFPEPTPPGAEEQSTTPPPVRPDQAWPFPARKEEDVKAEAYEVAKRATEHL